MSRAGAKDAWTAGRLACTQPTTLRPSSDSREQAAEGRERLAWSSVSPGPGSSTSGAPAATWHPLRLRKMVPWPPGVLRRQKAGHFPWDSAPFQVHLGRTGHGQVQRGEPGPVLPASCVGLSWISSFLTLSPPSHGGYTDSFPLIIFSDESHTCKLNGQTYMPISE